MNKLKFVIEPILRKLRCAPMLILLFPILISYNLDKTVKDYDNYVTRLSGLYQFSRNLYLGLREIARNVIEYTPTKLGILTGRVYISHVLLQVKDVCQTNWDISLFSGSRNNYLKH